MDVFQKFIIETDDIEGDCLIIAKCTYHKQLATDHSKVTGGGWWSLDVKSKTITLYGDSHDFGKASVDDIKDCLKRNKVFRNPSLCIVFEDEYNFNYRDEKREIIELVRG